MPDDLDREMDRLMAEAKALEWSPEGQIIHVRMGMERAYARLHQMTGHDLGGESNQ